MLTGLSIRNVVLIEALDLELASGLCVLTGETGAGKSILLDSLGLGLGERSDAGLLRHGATQASVALTFDLGKNHPAYAQLRALDLTALANPSEPLILRRVIGADGRSKAFVNDQPVAVHVLRQLGEVLVEIHGQFETHGLLNRDTHMGFLDRFAGIGKEVAALATLHENWKGACAACETATRAATAALGRAEDIRFSLDEFEKLNPQAGEAEQLADKRKQLQNYEKIIEALNTAHHDLADEAGAAAKLAGARRLLTRAAEKAPERLSPILDVLARAEDTLAEATANLEALMAIDGFDATTLETIEERLFALRAAARKYQCQPDALPAVYAQLKSEAALLEDHGAQLEKLETALQHARASYMAAAEKIHAARMKAATQLEKAIQAELPPLKLEQARFHVHIEKLLGTQAGASGISRVSFLAATNPGMPEGPLHKVASGGELARFMLALRLCLMEDAATTTLVFDEVDTGIGGATASAVGERLARLSATLQTLVVTHSPQVAARGHHHWRVEKQNVKGQTHTSVRVLQQEERLEEIARMLAGSTITDAARQAAASLLEGAAPTKAKKQRKAS